MSNQTRSGSRRWVPVAAILFRWPFARASLRSLTLALACVAAYVAVQWLGMKVAGFDPLSWYWLPNSLLLGALLLHRARAWWQLLLPAAISPLLSMPGSAAVAEQVGILLFNEGLACCAAVVLYVVRSGRCLAGGAGIAGACGPSPFQAISCALLPPVLVLMLSSTTTRSALLPTLVGFVTVTPAIVMLCRSGRESMTVKQIRGIVVPTLLSVTICSGARLGDWPVGHAALCALPLLAVWSGSRFGFAGLSMCLLVSVLLLQPLSADHVLSLRLGAGGCGLQLFLFATAVGSVAYTHAKLGSAVKTGALLGRDTRAAKKLRAGRARLRQGIERQNLILRATNEAILYWNIRRDHLRWSAKARDYFGAAHRASGGWQVWSDSIEDHDRERVLDDLRKFFAAGETRWQSEFHIARRDGVVVPIRSKGILIRDARGQPWRMAITLSNIADAGKAAQFLHAPSRSSRLATIGEITATITHEINQPLAAILNNAETALFLLQAGESRPETIREILEDIRADDLRASQIVRSTRALLQDRELVRKRIDLNDVVTSAVTLLSEAARRRAIRLTVALAPIPRVRADALLIEQAIVNLVNNGLDAAASGCGGRQQVEVCTCSSNARVQVCVKDTGRGIPASDLERIFESFHTTKVEGLGLGLSLARVIVSAHGGRIFAENNESGFGACVCFELPAAEECESSAPPLDSHWSRSDAACVAGRQRSGRRPAEIVGRG